MTFKSEYELRMIRCGENMAETIAIIEATKPKRSTNSAGQFTPMGPDDYHHNGKLVQERESFLEQEQRTARFIKQQRL